MNQRQILMMLLVISLAAGPLLLAVPSVYAGKIKTPEVIVLLNDGPPDFEQDITDWFEITEASTQFNDDTWIKVGNIYNIIPDPLDPFARADTLLNDVGDPHNITVLLLVENKYKKWVNELHIVTFAVLCDYTGAEDGGPDGVVDAEDFKLISRANSQPDLYQLQYDLNLDGVITNDDILIAHQFEGPAVEQWITLPLSVDPSGHTHVNTVFLSAYNRWYAVIRAGHFSGWGIRR
jgi:hypothetical protein